MEREPKDVLKSYESSLEDLTFNSKPIINMLTMTADKYKEQAPEIVELIESRVLKVASPGLLGIRSPSPQSLVFHAVLCFLCIFVCWCTCPYVCVYLTRYCIFNECCINYRYLGHYWSSWLACGKEATKLFWKRSGDNFPAYELPVFSVFRCERSASCQRFTWWTPSWRTSVVNTYGCSAGTLLESSVMPLKAW